MPKTISTHTGSAAYRAHNIRDPKATDKQEHIDKSLKHMDEIIIDETPRAAYQRLFGAALEKYNAGQIAKGHPERVINDYYAHIEGDAKKHPVYEMIVQIGDRNDTGIDCPVEKECMREFLSGWKERNPNMEVIGAYLHADETDGTAHMHIDYIPVIRDCKRGLEVQTGLSRALGQQGFEKGKSYKDTPQIRWEARENAALEAICRSHGIEIHHPMRDGAEERREHIDTATYKAKAALEEVENELAEASTTLKNVQGEVNTLSGQKDALNGQISRLESQRDQMIADSNQFETATKEKIEALRNEGFALIDQKHDLAIEKNKLKAEVELLKKELQPYRDLQIGTTGIDEIEVKPVLLKPGMVMVKEDDLTKIKEQAKAYVANRGEIDHVRERVRDVTVRETLVDDKEKRVKAAAVQVRTQQEQVEQAAARQANLNQLLQEAERERDDLKHKNTSLAAENASLRSEVSSFKEIVSDLKDKLYKAFVALRGVVQAVGLLKHTQNKYRAEQLTEDQNRLIDGVSDYAADQAREAGFDVIANDIDKHVDLWRDVAAYVEPQREHGRSHSHDEPER